MKRQSTQLSPTELTAAEELVDRLTDEGLCSAIDACHDGGLPGTSLWASIRLCKSGKLEAIKVSGRWMSTIPAVRRYLVHCAKDSFSAAPRSVVATEADDRNDRSKVDTKS